MGKGWDSSWRDFRMPTKPAPGSTETLPSDRGSLRGAKRCIVTAELQLLDHKVAKDAGIKGVFFQSRKEAKYYISLEVARRAGKVRPLPGQDRWRQVKFPLFAIRPDGLKEIVAHLVLDFAYESLERVPPRETLWTGEEPGARCDPTATTWVARYEDVKPRAGGLREDVYLLKKKWFEIQYGIPIVEV